jgi:subtilisin family serine protease
LTFPHIARQPAAWEYSQNRVKTSLPTYDPDSHDHRQMDLRHSDLSLFDLRNSSPDLFYADFDSQTTWPPADRMPADYDPQQIMEIGRNPGLGLRQLHTQGITGQGVGIAVIDTPLLTEHQEYADQLKWYEELNVGTEDLAQMHGAAVVAIAVGKTVGVAPQADLYYIAYGDNLMAGLFQAHYLAVGIRRVLEINRQLPDNQKIRVISISAGWGPSVSGYSEVQRAAGEARAAGMLVISSNVTEVHGFKFHGLGRSPLADPDVLEFYELGAWWAYRFSTDGPFSDRLLVPMDARTTASPSGASDYVFYRQGGWSWSIPYIAGMYALAAQVDPSITPDRFWSLALETGRTIELEHEGKTYPFGPILDPAALIAALQVRHAP